MITQIFKIFVEYCQPAGFKIHFITDLVLPEREPWVVIPVRISQARSQGHIHHHKLRLGNVLLLAETDRPCK